MQFCECGGMIIGSKCRNCGKKNENKVHVKITNKAKSEGIEVIEDNTPDLPDMKKECKKCHNDRAYYWLIQTRSADEPPTQFFKCTKCKHTWREYK
jgi:DNA-directed RNA polymerase subunit M